MAGISGWNYLLFGGVLWRKWVGGPPRLISPGHSPANRNRAFKPIADAHLGLVGRGRKKPPAPR